MNNLEELINEIKKMSNIKLLGLMSIAPNVDDISIIRESFKKMNQLKNKSSYHELFIKNLKRTSSTSIKVNTKSISSNSNNNQAVNVIYKK